MTDCEIVQKLANGYTATEVSVENKINRRTLEKRIEILKQRTLSKNTTNLIANYLRKKLIV
jgi:DNA-binding CsgD family transcriptional regulator